MKIFLRDLKKVIRDLKKIISNPKRLIRALEILWMRIWFLLIPMRCLLILENRISDMIVVVMVVALFLIATESESKKKKKIVFVIIVIEEDYTKSSSSEDGYVDDYENDNFMKNVHDPFPDLDRKLGHIVDQVDDRTFQARFCETDSIVTCYLSHDLFHKNIRPVVGDLVRLEYSSGFGLRMHYIIQVIDSEIEKGSPWVWNILLAEIVGEDDYMGERIIYVRLEPEQLVPCKVSNYLLNTYMQGGDIVLVEVNQTNRSFYKVLDIFIRYDSLGIP